MTIKTKTVFWRGFSVVSVAFCGRCLGCTGWVSVFAFFADVCGGVVESFVAFACGRVSVLGVVFTGKTYCGVAG